MIVSEQYSYLSFLQGPLQKHILEVKIEGILSMIE